MPNLRPFKPSWLALFSAVERMILSLPLPYVTRLSQRYEQATVNQRAFVVLLATILSLRTRDAVTETTTERLLKLADTPKKILKLTPTQLAKTIYPSAFFNQKAKQMQELCRLLIAKHHGLVPTTLEQLIALPGVGRKTANLVLTEGFGKSGICVDTHVHRILNRLNLVKTKTPDATEVELRKILPKRYWLTINYLLVMFGMSVCKPVGPKCRECLLQKSCAEGLQIQQRNANTTKRALSNKSRSKHVLVNSTANRAPAQV